MSNGLNYIVDRKLEISTLQRMVIVEKIPHYNVMIINHNVLSDVWYKNEMGSIFNVRNCTKEDFEGMFANLFPEIETAFYVVDSGKFKNEIIIKRYVAMI